MRGLLAERVAPDGGPLAFPFGPSVQPVRVGRRFGRVSRLDSTMGGRLGIHVAVDTARPASTLAAEVDAARTAERIGAWARPITRFEATSDLVALNDDPREVVPVKPTLARVLEWGREAGELTEGIVDVTLLAERLVAEAAGPDALPPAAGRANPTGAGHSPSRCGSAWSIVTSDRGAVVVREPGLRFDLDGVGKGWIADRALSFLWRHPGALVDADGDLAVRVAPGDAWEIGIEDPRRPDHDLAVLRLVAPASVPLRFGVATSGVSIHRWESDGAPRHHLIDPRTRRPAETDIVQATVIAASAREAEALAKTVVILGAAAGFEFLDRAPVAGAVVLTDRGETLALPRTERLLA